MSSGPDDASSPASRGTRSRRRTHGALRTAEQSSANTPGSGAEAGQGQGEAAPGTSSSARRRRRRGGRGRGASSQAGTSAPAGAQE